MKKKIFLAALVALTLIGCEQKQSEFNFTADVKTATITGKVTWPGGADAKMIAKDSAYVRAVVANAQYSAGASGNKQFASVLTSQDGFYTIEVPVGQAGITDVFVEVIPFMGQYTDPNSKVTQTVYYTSGLVPVVASPMALNPGDVKNVDIEVMPELTFKDYTASVKISGKVTVNAGPQKTNGGYEEAVIPYVGKVKVKGSYTIDAVAKDFDFEDINIAAEANGAYSIEVPAGATAATITLTTERFDGKHNKIVNGEIVEEDVYYNIANLAINVTKDDVEKRNQDFTVSAYDPAGVDPSKEFEIKKIEFVVRTFGEVKNDKEEWEIGEAYLAFDVKATLSCPDYDTDYPSSPIKGNKLTFNVTPSTKDGKITMNNTKVYSEWEGYDIKVDIYVADKKINFTHHYDELSGFAASQFKKYTWAEWHEDAMVYNPLKKSFWERCWPREELTQSLEGYYESTTGGFTMSKNDLKYYSEYTYTSDIVVSYSFREPKEFKGLWTNKDYNTVNDYDEELDSYPKLKASDKAVDKDEKTWDDLGISESNEVRQQDKYQGACASYWKAQFPGLW